mmetsp:Transcript_6823/g.10217  ORF Transcript_6823/g.10217 Transcript_6823/m.10217 type:complete len:236 (+) Transcript_6823:2192-2899(+)
MRISRTTRTFHLLVLQVQVHVSVHVSKLLLLLDLSIVGRNMIMILHVTHGRVLLCILMPWILWTMLHLIAANFQTHFLRETMEMAMAILDGRDLSLPRHSRRFHLGGIQKKKAIVITTMTMATTTTMDSLCRRIMTRCHLLPLQYTLPNHHHHYPTNHLFQPSRTHPSGPRRLPMELQNLILQLPSGSRGVLPGAVVAEKIRREHSQGQKRLCFQMIWGRTLIHMGLAILRDGYS